MSYYVYLEVDTPSEGRTVVAWIGNYTSNVKRMWNRALPPDGIAMLDGKPAGRVARALRGAVERMERNRVEYEAMNPPDGWGNYEGALDYLRSLAEACAAHPTTTIRVAR